MVNIGAQSKFETSCFLGQINFETQKSVQSIHFQ